MTKRRKYRRSNIGRGPWAVYGVTADELGTKGVEILSKHPRAIVINLSARLRRFYAALEAVMTDEERARYERYKKELK